MARRRPPKKPARCWNVLVAPDGESRRCDGQMREIEAIGGEVIALRCGLSGFVSDGDGRPKPQKTQQLVLVSPEKT